MSSGYRGEISEIAGMGKPIPVLPQAISAVDKDIGINSKVSYFFKV